MTKRRRSIVVLLAVAIALIAATPPSNQCPSYNDLIANQSGNFTWSGTPPSASPELVTYARYKALVANTPAAPCPAGIPDNEEVTWSVVISCAQTHTASQQSESVNGGYSTSVYNAKINPVSGTFTCNGPFGTNGYSGTPITLPAGTVAPTSASTELSLTLSSITYSGSTQIQIVLDNPSGSQVAGPYSTSGGSISESYYAAGAPAGTYSWVITQTGGTAGTCDPTDGAQGGGTQMTFSGTAFWYQ